MQDVDQELARFVWVEVVAAGPGAFPAVAGLKTKGVRDLMTTYYAAFLCPGTRWDLDKPVREQPFWDDHARFMDALFEAGAIILGGPFADRTGSLVIVAADNAAQVHEMFRSDPWTERDVLVVADVKEWTIFLDARHRP